MKQSEIIIDDRLVHYMKSGSGEVLLLLHGWGDKSDTFTSIIHLLQKKYTCIAVDLPGFGKSQMPPEAWNLTNYAAWLNKFCSKLNINPTTVIGHSNGGALAIHAIALGEITPKKLVLIAASGVREPGGGRRQVIKLIAKIGKIVTFWLPLHIKQRLQKKLYGTVGSDMLVAPHMQETFKLTVRQDIQRDAKAISIPTLLIYGEKDKATPMDQVGRTLHTLIPDSQFQSVANSGHFVHQEAVETVASRIKEFLS